MKSRRSAQTGFAAIAAIVIVVLLAALGGFMVSISNTQQLSSSQDIQGSRAYWAARAGLEWSVVYLKATPASCVTPIAAAPTPIEGFNIVVNCTPQSYDEGGVTRTILNIESKASTSGSVGSLSYVDRSVSAAVEL
jgi:MSHA biogenesis protein MshP